MLGTKRHTKSFIVINLVSGVSVVTHIFGFLSGLELGAMLLRDEVEKVKKSKQHISIILTTFFPALGKKSQVSFVDFLLLWVWSSFWDKHGGGGWLPRLLAPELLGSGMVPKQAEFELPTLIPTEWPVFESFFYATIYHPSLVGLRWHLGIFVISTAKQCSIESVHTDIFILTQPSYPIPFYSCGAWLPYESRKRVATLLQEIRQIDI